MEQQRHLAGNMVLEVKDMIAMGRETNRVRKEEKLKEGGRGAKHAPQRTKHMPFLPKDLPLGSLGPLGWQQ